MITQIKQLTFPRHIPWSFVKLTLSYLAHIFILPLFTSRGHGSVKPGRV